jgi:hypothetical protein
MGRVGELAREAYRNVRYGGPGVVYELLSRAYFTYAASSDGDPVFEADWDLLVVLDACRADLWNEVAPQHDHFGPADTRTSVGATSTEWLAGTFEGVPDDVLANTAYVTGNPYTDAFLDADRFGRLDEAWRYAWDDDLGTIPARPLTDRAIAAGREDDPDRLIVHYMQPHFPCVPCPGSGDGIALDRFGEEPISIWEELRFGRRDADEVWDRYRENLRYVLDEVGLLFENVDADRAVVTADHGNAVGEHGLYGHVEGVSLPCLREVPWYETVATDEQTHDPADYESEPATTDADVTERLQALGYAEE